MRRHLLLRAYFLLVLALWTLLWPAHYGFDEHTWWGRLVPGLLMIIKAVFVGSGTAMLIFRPMLTVRTSTERPLLGFREALRELKAKP